MSLKTPPPEAMVNLGATILENVKIARDTYRIRIADAEMARRLKPGQFVMLRTAPESSSDPLLGRPLALYDIQTDANGAPAAIDLVYLVIGRGTASLAGRKPGERLAIWGPLGNGFGPPPAESGSVLFVAGGIGQTPFLALGRDWLGSATYGGVSPDEQRGRVESATLLYGARTAELLAGVDDFRAAGIEVEVATDDGSAGHKGFVTQLLTKRLERGERPVKILACGPPPMLAAVAAITKSRGIPCDVSLENHMACGFGVCFSCVAPIIQDDGQPDLRRVCVEGPVFPADRVDWSTPPR